MDTCTADYAVCCNNGDNKIYQSAQVSGLDQTDTFQIFSSQAGDYCAVSIGIGALGTAPICLNGGTMPFITGARVNLGGTMSRIKRSVESVSTDGYGYIEDGIGYTIKVDSPEGNAYEKLTSVAEKEEFIKARYTWTGKLDSN